MFDMVRKIWMPSSSRRRKRALDNLRRQVASCGYALDDLTDDQLEALITRGEGSIEMLPPLTGKTLYWTLRRISPDIGQLQRRKIRSAPQV